MTPELDALLRRVGTLAPGAKEIEDDIRRELLKPAALWPDGVMEVVAECVSPSVWNPASQTYKGLNRRITWAYSVWADRYAPLTMEQRQYISELLIWAVKKAVRESNGDKRRLYPMIHTNIDHLVNHETVHAGFQSRDVKLVDVTRELAAVGS